MNSSDVFFRLASPDIPLAMEIVDDGSKDGHCRMGGVIGVLFDIVILETKKLIPGSKCVINKVAEVGSWDPRTKSFSGAIGDVLSGSVDCSFIPVFYPMVDEKESIVYTRPIVEDEMKICSFYNISSDESSKVKDILFMFDTIPIMLWIELFISFLAFVLVLKIGHQLLDKSKPSNATWITTCAFLDQDNFPTNRRHIIVLSFFMSVGLFCAIAYLTNSVSTDLVVVPKPVTINSYDDVISREIGVVTSKVFPEMAKFLEQDPESKEGKIAKLFQIKAVDPTKLGPMMKEFFEQKLVIVARPLLTESTAMYMLSQDPDPGIHALHVTDPAASKFTNVFILRRDLNPQILKIVQRKITQLYESGIANEVYSKAAVRIMPQTGADMKPSTTRKMHTQVKIEESVFIPVKYQNVIIFFRSFFIMILLPHIVLGVEIFANHHKKNRKTNLVSPKVVKKVRFAEVKKVKLKKSQPLHISL